MPPFLSRSDAQQRIREAATLEDLCGTVNACLGQVRASWGDRLDDALMQAHAWTNMKLLVYHPEHPEAAQETLALARQVALILLEPSPPDATEGRMRKSPLYRLGQFFDPTSRHHFSVNEGCSRGMHTWETPTPKWLTRQERRSKALEQRITADTYARYEAQRKRVGKHLAGGNPVFFFDFLNGTHQDLAAARTRMNSWEDIDAAASGALHDWSWMDQSPPMADRVACRAAAPADRGCLERLKHLGVGGVSVAPISHLGLAYQALSVVADAYDVMVHRMGLAPEHVGLGWHIHIESWCSPGHAYAAAFKAPYDEIPGHFSFGPTPSSVGHEWTHGYDHRTRGTPENRKMRHALRQIPKSTVAMQAIVGRLHGAVDQAVRETLHHFWQHKGAQPDQPLPQAFLQQAIALTHAPHGLDAAEGFLDLLNTWKQPGASAHRRNALHLMSAWRAQRRQANAVKQAADRGQRSAFVLGASLIESAQRFGNQAPLRMIHRGSISDAEGVYYNSTNELLARAGEQWMAHLPHPAFAIPERSDEAPLWTWKGLHFPQDIERDFLKAQLEQWVAPLKAAVTLEAPEAPSSRPRHGWR